VSLQLLESIYIHVYDELICQRTDFNNTCAGFYYDTLQAEKTAARTSPTHPSYEILSEDFIKEYGATTTLYKHTKSGAEVLSVQIDDDNKVKHTRLLQCMTFCRLSMLFLCP
jgi:hypothetical protein